MQLQFYIPARQILAKIARTEHNLAGSIDIATAIDRADVADATDAASAVTTFINVIYFINVTNSKSAAAV